MGNVYGDGPRIIHLEKSDKCLGCHWQCVELWGKKECFAEVSLVTVIYAEWSVFAWLIDCMSVSPLESSDQIKKSSWGFHPQSGKMLIVSGTHTLGNGLVSLKMLMRQVVSQSILWQWNKSGGLATFTGLPPLPQMSGTPCKEMEKSSGFCYIYYPWSIYELVLFLLDNLIDSSEKLVFMNRPSLLKPMLLSKAWG